MNIYIYGSQSFKKEIYNTLIHSNIKSKLDASSIIKEIDDLEELKKAIQKNPKEIFLIDDSKIIKKNSLNRRIKFLTPKDGIEEEFLLNSGIADLSVDSLDEIPKYILRKYEKSLLQEQEDLKLDEDFESLELNEDLSKEFLNTDTISIHENNIDLDDELEGLLTKNEDSVSADEEMESSIKELEDLFVNEAQQESVYTDENIDFNDNFGLNNISFDYDANSTINGNENFLSDEKFLESLLDGTSIEEENIDNIEESFEEINFLDDIFNKITVENKEDKEFKEKVKKADTLELDELLSKIEENKEEIKIEKIEEIKVSEPLKGDMMNEDDFSELDGISEKDLLDALNLESNASQNSEHAKIEVLDTQKEAINISSSNVDELAKLFSKILNNKTLEITIKIKD